MIKIAISTGELSGDEHAADLVRALRQIHHDIQVRGMAGHFSRQAGVETLIDCEASASLMGFQEVLFSARRVLRSLNTLKDLLRTWRPDLLILIDYPDFNFRLAKEAKSLGIKVFYFITPQVWAWRASRVGTLNRLVDLAAVIFPFERPFLEAHGFSRVVYVGHPFCDRLKRLPNPADEANFRLDFLLEHGLDPHAPTIAVFPGSRSAEISRHYRRMLEAVRVLRSNHPEVQIIVGATNKTQHLLPRVKEHAALERSAVVSGRSLEILRCVDAALLKSGTSNLQAAFFAVPFAMFYRLSLTAELILRVLIKRQEFSIVNVIRPGTVHELVQHGATVANTAREMEQLLFDKDRRSELTVGLKQVTESLASFDSHALFSDCRSVSARTARLALSLLS